MPVAGTHVPAVWHWPGAAQVSGLLCVHAPLTQASVCMHLLVAWHPIHVAPIAPQLLVDCMFNGTHVVGPEQHPAHEVESQTHCPALLQSSPAAHFPLVPVHVPPAPSEPPQATPAQLATLQAP
jgi:hypothetical protein